MDGKGRRAQDRYRRRGPARRRTSGHTFVISKIRLRLICLASLYVLGCNLGVFRHYCYTPSSSGSFGHLAVEIALQIYKSCCELVAVKAPKAKGSQERGAVSRRPEH